MKKKTPKDESFGARLQQLMDEAELSQGELAKLAGMKPPTISRWLSKRKAPVALKNANNIARVLGTTSEMLE